MYNRSGNSIVECNWEHGGVTRTEYKPTIVNFQETLPIESIFSRIKRNPQKSGTTEYKPCEFPRNRPIESIFSGIKRNPHNLNT